MSKNEQKNVFKELRNKGILEDNKVECLKDNPVFFTGKKCTGDPLLCSNCGGFFSKIYFYRHKKICQKDGVTISKPVSARFVMIKDLESNFTSQVLDGKTSDSLWDFCCFEPTIKLVGMRLWERDKAKIDKIMETRKKVRNSMRNLGRLYQEFKQLYFSQNDASMLIAVRDMFCRENFKFLREAIDNLTLKDGDNSSDDAPNVKYGFKTNLYYLLTNTASILKASYLEKKGSEGEATEIDYFLTVLKMNEHYIFGDAHYQLNKSRQERLRLPSRLPDEVNVRKLREFTQKTISNLSDEYVHIGKHEFINLRNAVCSRLTLFNARRGGEPSRLKITQWTERSKWVKESQLDEVEAKLFSSMAIAYQTGKGNHVVSVMVPTDSIKAMDLLCDKNIRKDASIDASNPYIFANTEDSLMHVLGWSATKFMCDLAGIEDASINATVNRARISTLYAALEVPECDREYFYTHMGHTKAVNKGTYQRPLPLLAIEKVGKHLIQFDQGYGKFLSVPLRLVQFFC